VGEAVPNDHHGKPPRQQDVSALDLEFGELLRTLRQRIGMTQEQLSTASGVGVVTIGDLERGVNTGPRHDTVQRLCDALLLSDEERAMVWTAWEKLKERRKAEKSTASAVREQRRDRPEHSAASDRVEIEHLLMDEAPTGSALFSRDEELATLKYLTVDERCRIVATIGLRGMGKTNLVTTFLRGGQDVAMGRALANRFDYGVWLSLISSPPLSEILRRIILFVSNKQETDLPENEDDLLKTLFSYLHDHPCLIILDNVETILSGGADLGHYQTGYEGYGKLLHQFAERPHISCLLLTSREKPEEIAQLETKSGPVRVFPLAGIDADGCRAIFERIDDTFTATDQDWERLTRQYEGSPLALDLAARHIRAAYGGSLAAFLHDGNTLFRGLDDLLDWYFGRFNDLQKEILYWLACAREPISLDGLRGLLVSLLSRQALPSTLQALQQALPIQQAGAAFTLQPVLMEYMSARLIEQVVAELTDERINLLNSHAVLLALAKDYIRDIHGRVFLDPILQEFTARIGQQDREEALWRMIRRLQYQPPTLRGYAAGNLINLLLQLGADLSGHDFSRLHVRQAYLREASLVDVNFTDCSFEKSAFTDMFGNVLSVAFSPDPFDTAIIAAGTGTGEIRLWRASDGMPLATYTGHTDWIWGLAYSPDGRLLASGSSDTTIRLWDTSCDKNLYILRGHKQRVRSVAFGPDGKFLASASEDGRIGLWNVESGELIRFLEGHAGPVREVAFTPDGTTLASCGDDATVRVWDVESGTEKLALLVGHDGPVWSLAVSPDGRTIASGGDDHTIFLWETASGKRIRTLRGHAAWICSLAFSPVSDLLASASADANVRLWDLTTGEPVRVLQGHRNWVNAVRFHASGMVLVSGSHDQTVRLWDTASGNSMTTLQGYNNGVRAVAFSSLGDLLATADRSVRLWNPANGNVKAVLSGHSAYIRTLSFSPDGKYLASGSDDRSSRIWSLPAGRPHRLLTGHTNRVKSVAFSPDGLLVATGSDDNTVRLWDVATQRAARVLEGHTNRIRAVAFSPKGMLVGSGSDDSTARLWNTQSGEVAHTLKGHGSRIWSIAFSPEGDLFATGSEDSTIRLWDTATGKCLRELRGHTHPVWAIAFHPDGAIIASSSEDATIRLWDAASGECRHVLQGHTKPVWALAFSPDRLHLASGSHDHTVRLWNSYTGQGLTTFTGHQDAVWFVAFHPGGALLASGGDDGACYVWDVARKTCAHILRGARLYERMNIGGITGVSEAQLTTLKALGAIEM
jgi:WD40 repeat protein/transcriptional regulator with XRE-family HTH domain